MSESIERLIAGMPLPEPSSELDRRVGELWRAQPIETVRRRRRGGVIAVAGGAIAVCGLLLMSQRTIPPVDQTRQFVPADVGPVVETLEVSIPVLDSSSRGDNQDGIFSPDHIVVSTSLQEGVEE